MVQKFTAKQRLFSFIFNKCYQKAENLFIYSSKNLKPRLTMETLGLRNGAGVSNFQRLMYKFKKWGWIVNKNSGYDKADYIIIHFRPISNYNKYLPDIKKAKNNGTKIIIYLIEPLDLRPETWGKNLSPLNSVIETLELCDAIVVNSIGYLYCPLYEELKTFEPYLAKTVLIEESILEELHGGLPIKQHKTTEPVAAWHGYPINMSRWVLGEWPGNLNLDPLYYPNVYQKKNSEVYGNLHETLDIPLITIARYHPDIQSEKLYPGDLNIGRLLQQYDVGIAPFFTNIYRTLNKPFGAKIQTYMMAGLPVIASPIPDYTRWIEHEKTGLLAESKKEWKEASQRLKDPLFRQKISDNARAMVLMEFTPDRIIGKFEMLFNALKNKESNLPFSILNYNKNNKG
ncbi:hypothetical protein GMMP1_580024 [Candidatus Magnetomoraceae bacterium gMMP-1]